MASLKDCLKRVQLLRTLLSKRNVATTTSREIPLNTGRTVSAAKTSSGGFSQIDKTTRSAALTLPPGPSTAHINVGLSLTSAGVEFHSIDSDYRRLFGSGLLYCLGKLGLRVNTGPSCQGTKAFSSLISNKTSARCSAFSRA